MGGSASLPPPIPIPIFPSSSPALSLRTMRLNRFIRAQKGTLTISALPTLHVEHSASRREAMAVSGSRCCAGDFGGEVCPGHVYRVEHVQVVEEVCRRGPPAGAKEIVKQDSLQGGRESQTVWFLQFFLLLLFARRKRVSDNTNIDTDIPNSCYQMPMAAHRLNPRLNNPRLNNPPNTPFSTPNPPKE
jgi:hypothetical protein